MAKRTLITTFPNPSPRGKSGDPVRERMERALEKMMAAADRLIAELDAIDGDADLEEEPGEPSLGATEAYGFSCMDQRPWGLTGLSDREGPDVDLEPTLGSLDQHVSQTGWGGGRDVVGEDEPSLGSLGDVDQMAWGAHEGGPDLFGRGLDFEAQCEDEGADSDREPRLTRTHVEDQRAWATALSD